MDSTAQIPLRWNKNIKREGLESEWFQVTFEWFFGDLRWLDMFWKNHLKSHLFIWGAVPASTWKHAIQRRKHLPTIRFSQVFWFLSGRHALMNNDEQMIDKYSSREAHLRHMTQILKTDINLNTSIVFQNRLKNGKQSTESIWRTPVKLEEHCETTWITSMIDVKVKHPHSQ